MGPREWDEIMDDSNHYAESVRDEQTEEIEGDSYGNQIDS